MPRRRPLAVAKSRENRRTNRLDETKTGKTRRRRVAQNNVSQNRRLLLFRPREQIQTDKQGLRCVIFIRKVGIVKKEFLRRRGPYRPGHRCNWYFTV